MIPVEIGGALISGGSSLLGGLFSSKSNLKATKAQIAAQKEFAQHGVSWRVADAKQAGLHPLYALGAQTPSFTPMVIPDSMGPAISEAGQAIGRAVAQTGPQAMSALDQANLALLKSQLAESDARVAYINSETMRNTNEQINRTLVGATALPDLGGLESATTDIQRYGAGGGYVQPVDGQSVPQGLVTVQAPPISITAKGDSSRIAGDPALWRAFDAGGMKIYLPGGIQGDATEVLETLAESPLMMYMVYRENLRRQGKAWGHQFEDRFLTPDFIRSLRSVQKKIPSLPEAWHRGYQWYK